MTRFLKNTTALLALSLTAWLGQACTDGFEELNTPPTSVTAIDPGLIVSKTQRDFAFGEGYEYPNNQYGSWVQHWAGGVLISSSRYVQQADDGLWNDHYTLLRNISQIRTSLLAGQESSPKARTKLAIARIIEISVWQRLTDLFGDVPFTETARGPEYVNNTPKFDTQESIYRQLLADLDAASANLTATDDSYGNADFYYKGNVDKWKRYANSLKLRMGMRVRYADAALAQKTVTEAMAQPLLASNADNAAVPTFNDATNGNVHPVLNHFLAGSPDLKYLGEAFVGTLVAKADPRLPRLAEPTVNSKKAGKPAYRGIGVALTDDLLKGIIKDDYSTASLTTWFSKAYAPAIPCNVLTFSDVSFLKAEAALEGWGATADKAEGFYQDGVKAALAQAPYNVTTIPADYAAELNLAETLTKEQKLEKIGTQKWIQLFGRSYEAFTEWRRMGYPALKPGPNAGSTGGKIPRRAVYSAREALLNPTNYAEAAARLASGDSYLSRVWWDRK